MSTKVRTATDDSASSLQHSASFSSSSFYSSPAFSKKDETNESPRFTTTPSKSSSPHHHNDEETFRISLRFVIGIFFSIILVLAWSIPIIIIFDNADSQIERSIRLLGSEVGELTRLSLTSELQHGTFAFEGLNNQSSRLGTGFLPYTSNVSRRQFLSTFTSTVLEAKSLYWPGFILRFVDGSQAIGIEVAPEIQQIQLCQSNNSFYGSGYPEPRPETSFVHNCDIILLNRTTLAVLDPIQFSSEYASLIPSFRGSFVRSTIWNITSSLANQFEIAGLGAGNRSVFQYPPAATLRDDDLVVTYISSHMASGYFSSPSEKEYISIALVGQFQSEIGPQLREFLPPAPRARAYLTNIPTNNRVVAASHGAISTLVTFNSSAEYRLDENCFGGTDAGLRVYCFYNISDHPDFYLLRGDYDKNEYISITVEFDFQSSKSALNLFLPTDFYLQPVENATRTTIIVIIVLVVAGFLSTFLLLRLVLRRVEVLACEMGEDPFERSRKIVQERKQKRTRQQEEHPEGQIESPQGDSTTKNSSSDHMLFHLAEIDEVEVAFAELSTMIQRLSSFMPMTARRMAITSLGEDSVTTEMMSTVPSSRHHGEGGVSTLFINTGDNNNSSINIVDESSATEATTNNNNNNNNNDSSNHSQVCRSAASEDGPNTSGRSGILRRTTSDDDGSLTMGELGSSSIVRVRRSAAGRRVRFDSQVHVSTSLEEDERHSHNNKNDNSNNNNNNSNSKSAKKIQREQKTGGTDVLMINNSSNSSDNNNNDGVTMHNDINNNNTKPNANPISDDDDHLPGAEFFPSNTKKELVTRAPLGNGRKPIRRVAASLSSSANEQKNKKKKLPASKCLLAFIHFFGPSEILRAGSNNNNNHDLVIDEEHLVKKRALERAALIVSTVMDDLVDPTGACLIEYRNDTFFITLRMARRSLQSRLASRFCKKLIAVADKIAASPLQQEYNVGPEKSVCMSASIVIDSYAKILQLEPKSSHHLHRDNNEETDDHLHAHELLMMNTTNDEQVISRPLTIFSEWVGVGASFERANRSVLLSAASSSPLHLSNEFENLRQSPTSRKSRHRSSFSSHGPNKGAVYVDVCHENDEVVSSEAGTASLILNDDDLINNGDGNNNSTFPLLPSVRYHQVNSKLADENRKNNKKLITSSFSIVIPRAHLSHFPGLVIRDDRSVMGFHNRNINSRELLKMIGGSPTTTTTAGGGGHKTHQTLKIQQQQSATHQHASTSAVMKMNLTHSSFLERFGDWIFAPEKSFFSLDGEYTKVGLHYTKNKSNNHNNNNSNSPTGGNTSSSNVAFTPPLTRTSVSNIELHDLQNILVENHE